MHPTFSANEFGHLSSASLGAVPASALEISPLLVLALQFL